MNEKFLSKIEINLPINIKISQEKILSKLIDFFTDTEGIGGCTYSLPSQPPILKGRWLNKNETIAKHNFNDDVLVQNLLRKKIIKEDEENANIVVFDNAIRNKDDLVQCLNDSDIEEKDAAVVLGIWKKLEILDDIIWIYACYDIEGANIELKKVIGFIKKLIETEGGEDLAWITYSNVGMLS